MSIFGAVGLCPPEQLLPLAAQRLCPGGRLLFSVPHHDWLGPNRNRIRLADGTTAPVARWTANTIGWKAAVAATGLNTISLKSISAPDGRLCCTVIIAERSEPSDHYQRPLVST